jgi:hypothetical protein
MSINIKDAFADSSVVSWKPPREKKEKGVGTVVSWL